MNSVQCSNELLLNPKLFINLNLHYQLDTVLHMDTQLYHQKLVLIDNSASWHCIQCVCIYCMYVL